MPDVRDVLERAAASPDRGADTDAILRRARTLDRRRKAVWAAVPALLLVVGLVLAPVLGARPSVLLGPGGHAERLPLPSAGDAVPEFLADGTPVFVVHGDQGQVSVVEAIDPHRVWGMRQLVGWCPTAGWFEGFRTGSRFAPGGPWLAGPAPEGLATYEARVEGREVLVGERRAAEPRRELDFRQAGPSCEEQPFDIVWHEPAERLDPKDAAARARPGWLVVTGVLVHREGEMPRLCNGDGNLSDCPVAHGVEPRAPDLRWRMLDGRFLVRFRGGDAVEVVLWHDVSVSHEEETGLERHFGSIQSLERREDGSIWIDFQRADWLSGEEADEAARAAGEIGPGETVPNDYFIRRPPADGAPRLAARLSDDVEVFGDINLNRRGPGLVPMTVDALFAAEDLSTIPFWVTIDRATWTVVRIEEQYVP